jgi:hypothetical protein
MNIVTIILGFIVLLFGMRLFWLFVGVVGFVVGMNLAAQFMAGQNEWVIIAAGLVAGLIGAVLAVIFQRIAVAIAGFLAGAYLATFLLTSLGVDMGAFEWVIWIIGGAIGGTLVFALFDWALIVLSSLVGASLVAPAFTVETPLQTVLFLVLAVVGIVFQAGLGGRGRGYRRRRRI